jgi:flagellar hook-basal body complex protein FliE
MSLFIFAGALIRQFFVLMHAGSIRPTYPVAGVLLIAVAFWVAMPSVSSDAGSTAQTSAVVVLKEIQPIIERHVQEAQEEFRPRLEGLLELASAAGLGSMQSLEKEILDDVVNDAFGQSLSEAAEGASVGASVTAAVSGVVGYIIADIILFYVLSIIGGFLNPILLGAAVVIGGAAYLFIGKEAVKDKVRDKIATKLKEELSSSKVKKKLQDAVEKATREQFSKLAHEYANQVNRLVKRAKQAHQKAQNESAEKQENLAEVVTNVEKAQQALQQMAQKLRRDISELETRRECV